MRIPFTVDIRGTLKRGVDPNILPGAQAGFEEEMQMYFDNRLKTELEELTPSADDILFSRDNLTKTLNGKQFFLHYDYSFKIKGEAGKKEFKETLEESIDTLESTLQDVERLLQDFAYFLDEFSAEFKGRPFIKVQLNKKKLMERVLRKEKENVRSRIARRTLLPRLPADVAKKIASFAYKNSGLKSGSVRTRRLNPALSNDKLEGGRRLSSGHNTRRKRRAH